MFFTNSKGRNVIRVTDTTDHGGEVITGADNWSVYGKPVARIGDLVRCPKCLNQTYPIVEGDQTITTHGRQVAFEGHLTACGARLISSLSGHTITHSDGFSAGIAGTGAGGIAGNSLANRNNATQNDEHLSHHRRFRLLGHDGQPLSDIPYRISSSDSNKTLDGRTNISGMTEDFQTANSENAVFSIVAAGQEYEGSRAQTFLYHQSHVTEVKAKIYWLHENLWDEHWIGIYRRTADSIATLLQRNTYSNGRTVTYTCEDFALSILVHFAHRNKLPLHLKTGAANFRNIDFEIDSRHEKSDANMQGFLQDVQTAYGARDTLKNCFELPNKENVKTGDLFLRRNNDGHVQVVVSNNGRRIEIKQGSFPTNDIEGAFKRGAGGLTGRVLGGEHGAGAPTGAYYLGVEAQNAEYNKLENGEWEYKNFATGANDISVTWNLMVAFQWNFKDWNNY